MSAPSSRDSREAPISLSQAMNSPVPGTHGRRFEACQMAEKSGLPSGSRGVGAFRLGVPSAFRGTPWRWKLQPLAEAQHRHGHDRNQDKTQTTPHALSFEWSYRPAGT